MTIKEVVTLFQKEKQEAVASRFPCRAVMVKTIEQYCSLLSELRKISDIRVIQSAELFAGADVLPKYSNLQSERYHNEWVILTGVSEYLRLFSRKELTDHRLLSFWSHQVPSYSTGRILIPLWGCEAQWFDKSIGLAGDLRQNDFYYDCSEQDAPEQLLSVLVLSGMFEQFISKLETIQGVLKIGLQEWFDYWAEPIPDNTRFVLLTKRCSNIATTNGSVSIHVMTDTLSFIRENMAGAEALTVDNCTGDMQGMLFEFALKGVTLDEAILHILNMSSFSGIDVMAKWKTMAPSSRQFVSLWLSMHPDNSYLCHCLRNSGCTSEVASTVLHEIFKFRLDKPEWIAEYRKLAAVMAITPDAVFFKELDLIPSFEARLDFLSGGSRGERVYLLRMVGEWMRTDYLQVASSTKLQEVYPELFAYLGNGIQGSNDELASYMSNYKAHKLENSLPNDEYTYFNGVQSDVYDNRYSIISDYIDSDVFILWIDALGAEWLPLLSWSLLQHCKGSIKMSSIGQAQLPTETCYNELWKNMDVPYEKLDKLDKLAHKGVIDEPDYYACVEDQISFVSDIGKRVSDLLEEHHRVIITGDHGTSRLAARFFHTRDGVDVPGNAKVCSHGRYCELAPGTSLSVPNVHIVKHSDGMAFAVFTNYDHFKQSGFAAGAEDDNAVYGEVHGGATPEEMLVPIIVIDSNSEIPLTADWANNTVKLSMKRAQLTLSFNKPVKQLQIKAAGIDGIASPTNSEFVWHVVLPGIKPGSYLVQVSANNRIVTMPVITIQPALSGDGDLP